MRKEFALISGLLLIGLAALSFLYEWVVWSLVVIGPLILIGIQDAFQKKHAIRRNFPIFGHFRYLFEAIRPEINQYFVESNTDGVPFSREERSLVYQRAKGELDTVPFGTQKNVYEIGYEWLNHSIVPTEIHNKDLRVLVGGPHCRKPYSASIVNISAMSYGALSKNAIMALNGGAKDGGFAHNTGEGGLSPYHLASGGDLIWQIGTGYFSARNPDGSFCEKKFAEKASLEQVKMIELKLSQGAKPGHGGILPGKKVTQEIADIRGVLVGEDVISPPAHRAFSTPVEMMQFIGKLRELSGGKPVGFKLCVGNPVELAAICKAMEKTGITPDYIAIDGGEGGTGAAPLEFSNHIGTPGVESLIFVHNLLKGFGLRDQIRIFATGKATSGFDVIKRLALGADAVYMARSMMLALGCIQALRCNNNSCPTGVATQDPDLMYGLVVPEKRKRVATFHRETVKSITHMLEAMGLEKPSDLQPWHIQKRVSTGVVKNYSEIYEYIDTDSLKVAPVPASFSYTMRLADADSFRVQNPPVNPN
ncbi:MAG: FMN-binding glutamate synthase family protein [Bdellovibrionales bacterium]